MKEESITILPIVITENKAIECFNKNTLDTVLEDIKKKALNFVGDPSTPKGRAAIISKAAEVTKVKTTIEKIGKSLNEERKRLTDAVNADRNKAKTFLEDLKIKVRKPVTDWEEAEEKRLEAERLQAEIELDWDDAISMNDLFDREKAIAEKEAKMKAEEEERQRKIDEENAEKERIANQERIEREAKEKAEKEAAAKIEKAKQDAINAENERLALIEKAKQDKIDAENAAIEAKKQAEIEKQQAIEKAKRDAEEAEKKRAFDAKIKAEKEKAIADRKAANLNHQRKVNREILADLEQVGIDEELGKLLITLIVKKKVRNVQINY